MDSDREKDVMDRLVGERTFKVGVKLIYTQFYIVNAANEREAKAHAQVYHGVKISGPELTKRMPIDDWSVEEQCVLEDKECNP